ncbi:hypothetical protein BRC62_02610, partial [Halobacteriales archaeon QH_10_67_13]
MGCLFSLRETPADSRLLVVSASAIDGTTYFSSTLSETMRWPSPSYGAYAKFVVTVLVTMALLQYAGLSGPAGELAFLGGTG